MIHNGGIYILPLRKRISDYYAETEVDLFETCFKNIISEQIIKYEVNIYKMNLLKKKHQQLFITVPMNKLRTVWLY